MRIESNKLSSTALMRVRTEVLAKGSVPIRWHGLFHLAPSRLPEPFSNREGGTQLVKL